MQKSFKELAERGRIKAGHMLLGELTQGTWDNLEIHHMLKDGAWNFSCGPTMEMLETARSVFRRRVVGLNFSP